MRQPPVGEPPNNTFPTAPNKVWIAGLAANGDAITGYEGPRTWFSGVSAALNEGVVHFSPAIAPGESTYFALEAPGLEAAIAPVFGEAATTAPTSLSTQLSGAGRSGASLTVAQGTPVSDTATVSGPSAATATGAASYSVYSNATCTALVAQAGSTLAVTNGVAAASVAQNLVAGTYYWQASYGGDASNPPSHSSCGSEVLTVLAPPSHASTTSTTSTATVQSGGGVSGAVLTVPVGTLVTDKATISGASAATATGTIAYTLYSDAKCTVTASASSASVSAGVAGASAAVKPAAGSYYWKASCSGDAANAPSASACGSEVLVVARAASLGLPGSRACLSKRKFVIHPRAPKGVKLVSLEVQINGKAVHAARFTKGVAVSLVGLPKGTFRISVILKTAGGQAYEDTRTFHTCVAGKHKKHKK
jgi:hypothetical protein